MSIFFVVVVAAVFISHSTQRTMAGGSKGGESKQNDRLCALVGDGLLEK